MIAWARRYQTTSPDRGTVTNRFNAFGEMREIVAADGATTTLRYDILGRIHGANCAGGTPTLTFDRAVNEIGSLAETTSTDGVTETTAYDAFGRAATRTTHVAGQPYEFSYTYDLMGRLDRVMYPATPGWPQFETRNTYFPTLRGTSTGSKNRHECELVAGFRTGCLWAHPG